MAETGPWGLSGTEAARRIRAKELSAAELVRSCLGRIARLDPVLRAWVALDPDGALNAAYSVDRAIHQGLDPGPLAGLPVAIKDTFNTYNMPTGMGSPIWADFNPGNDARVVTDLRLAGAIILGKTVTAEFAVHSPGPTDNPHRIGYAAGTSSTGSAVAVAASMVPMGIGSQTAGSVIRPASYCGVYGFKPSFGLIPRTGCLKTTDTLDTVGFFTRAVEDLGLFFELLRVRGRNHPISEAQLSHPNLQQPLNGRWRVALVRGPQWNDAEAYAQAALLNLASQLAAQGPDEVVIEEAELPDGFNRIHDLHELIYCKSLSYYFKKEFESEDLISPILKSMILRGLEIGLEQYKTALEEQASFSALLDDWFGRYDVLLALSTGGEALPKEEGPNDRPDSSLIWTFCGAPSISVPAFTGPTNLPFGLQIVARRYGDYKLLRFARLLERLGLASEGTHPPIGQIEFKEAAPA